MGRIKLENIHSGMVLTADVTDRTGKVLLQSGSTIEEKHIKIFKIWGVSTVEIFEGEQPEVHEVPSEVIESGNLKQLEKQLAHHFRNTDSAHEAIRELRRLALEELARQTLEEGDEQR